VSISTSSSLTLSIIIINIIDMLLRSAMFNLFALYLLNLDQNT
jgi:hypothetical protein